MKYKVIGLVAAAAIIVVAIGAPFLISNKNEQKSYVYQTQSGGGDKERYHQHLSAKLGPEDGVNDGTFNSHLPLVSIDTNGKDIPGSPLVKDGRTVRDENGMTLFTLAEDGSTYVHGNVSVVDHKNKVNRLTDKPSYSSEINIRVRGNSSRWFDKKNYLVKLVDDKGENNAMPLLGMDKHHEWALHGPILDKSLMRNYLCYNVAGEFMDYAPNVRFCEVTVNGEYKGVYVMTEMITAGDDGARLPLTVSRKNNTFSGYLLRLDRGTPGALNSIDNFTHYTKRLPSEMEIMYPGTKNLTPEMAESIRQQFSDFEKALYSYDYDSSKYGYKKFIDTTSFADYLIFNEFSCNYDAGWLSTYIYKGIDEKYHMCIWDFNSAFDNYQQSALDNMHFEFTNVPWYVMLLKDEDFVDDVINRYRYLRKTYLSDEYLESYIDDVREYLGPAIDRNYEVWGYTFKDEMLRPAERNPEDYDEAINQMKAFIKIRGKWLDENIESLRQYANESKVKKFNENAN